MQAFLGGTIHNLGQIYPFVEIQIYVRCVQLLVHNASIIDQIPGAKQLTLTKHGIHYFRTKWQIHPLDAVAEEKPARLPGKPRGKLFYHYCLQAKIVQACRLDPQSKLIGMGPEDQLFAHVVHTNGYAKHRG